MPLQLGQCYFTTKLNPLIAALLPFPNLQKLHTIIHFIHSFLPYIGDRDVTVSRLKGPLE